MKSYTTLHKNRYVMPDRYILVVEDDLLQQARFAGYFYNLLGHQSNVLVTFASNAYHADFICSRNGSGMFRVKPLLIILDHDLQWGNGKEFLDSRDKDILDVPVITASGHPENNIRMMGAGANYLYTKDEIIEGKASALIMNLVGVHIECPKP